MNDHVRPEGDSTDPKPAHPGPDGPGHSPTTATVPPPASDGPYKQDSGVAGKAVSVGTAAPATVHTRRRLLIAGSAVLALLLAGYFGIPWVSRMLNTVSTDDAYINGHVTFVAPRVAGQVVKVMVDDNDRVHKGDILVQLDKEPYQIVVDAKQAAVSVAKAELTVAQDEVRGTIAQARANRYRLEHSIEDVNNQIAVLRANVAALQTNKAKLTRADADYQRGLKVQKNPGAITQEEVDQRKEAFLVAEAQAKQALQQVYQIRVSLGLPLQPKEGAPLDDIPEDLDQTFSSVRQAVADLLRSVAPLGIAPSSYDIRPKQLVEEFYKRDPEGNVDRIYAAIIADAPPIKLSEAKLAAAKNDLAEAQLNLSYCTIVAEIEGVVTRRNVNPGNNVVAGQSLFALRSLTEIWVDANFKETQLAKLRIGQAVDLDVDMYGTQQVFQGRISGFTMGTGSTLALLPAENATGNFVKVVQRLPVRIEFLDYDPERAPLFIGLSVTPYVRVKEPPTGPDAGKVLRPLALKSARE